jgi:hypothetical protein
MTDPTDTELVDQFRQFREECIWLRICHRNYEVLFENNEETLKLLGDVAAHFFHDLNRVMIDHQWLISARLLDNATSMGRPNLTVPYLNDALKRKGLLDAMIERAAAEVMIYRDILKDPRNRLLAHLDLEAVMSGQTRGKHTAGEYELFLERLQIYLDLVGGALGVGPLDIAPAGASGDAIDLVRALKSARERKQPRTSDTSRSDGHAEEKGRITMALRFTEKRTYDINKSAVRFEAFDGDKRIACGVSEIALQDAEGSTSLAPSDLEVMYDEHAEEVHVAAEKKYRAGITDKDGFILVTTSDLNN